MAKGSEQARLGAGVVLGETYRVEGAIGHGGMGAVYRGVELSTGREVAIKLCLGGALSERQRERFEREGRLTAALEHPGIVRVHSAGLHGEAPYLVYELVEGRTLEDDLTSLPLEERVRRIRDAALALGYAHRQQIVHRDVKPANLLVDAEGRVRVADFGLAVHSLDERLTNTGELVGTPSHMAPELLSGKVGSESPASDVWALGVILYEALTGQLPFPADSWHELIPQVTRGTPPDPLTLAPDVPLALSAICLRALSKAPERRYPDGDALAQDLDDWLAGRAPAGVALKGPRPAAGALLLLSVLVGIGLAAAGRGGGAQEVQAPAPSTGLPPEEAKGASAPPPAIPPLSDLLHRSPLARDERLAGLARWFHAHPEHPRREAARVAWRRLSFQPFASLTLTTSDVEGVDELQWLDEGHLVVLRNAQEATLVRWPGPGAAPERVDGVKLPGAAALLSFGPRHCQLALETPNAGVSVLRRQPLEALFRGELRPPDPETDVRFPRPPTLLAALPGGEGSLFAVAGEPLDDGSGTPVRVFEAVDEEPVERWSQRLPDHVDRLSFSPGGRWLVVITENEEAGLAVEALHLFSASDGARAPLKDYAARFARVAFSADEAHLAAPTRNNDVLLLDLDQGPDPIRLVPSRPAVLQVTSHGAPVRDAAFHEQRLFTVAGNRETGGTLRCWRLDGEEDTELTTSLGYTKVMSLRGGVLALLDGARLELREIPPRAPPPEDGQ